MHVRDQGCAGLSKRARHLNTLASVALSMPLDPELGPLPPALHRVSERGTLRRYKKGVVLIEEGEPGGTLFFVQTGLLRAYTARTDGQEFTFGFYGPGAVLGEMSLDGGPRSASVTVEETATCRCVSRQTLEQCIAEEPALAFELLALVIRRARALSDRARDLALHDAYGRLVLLLRAGSTAQPDGSQRMGFALTQAQLAQQIGCSRTMVTKLLGDLVKGGYLALEQRHWVTRKALPPRW